MELVIKIPEKAYKHIMSMQFYIPGARNGKSLLEEILKAIRTSTPLPKGHGDLIDRNSILCTDLPCDLCGHTDECFKLLAPTIIAAAKAESEG